MLKKSVWYFCRHDTMLSELGDHHHIYTVYSETKLKLKMTVQAHTTLYLLMS